MVSFSTYFRKIFKLTFWFGFGDFDLPKPESTDVPPSDGPGELKLVASLSMSDPFSIFHESFGLGFGDGVSPQ